jgi:hypothetical protein
MYLKFFFQIIQSPGQKIWSQYFVRSWVMYIIGLPDFSWHNIPKREKYTYLPLIANDHKIFKKCTNQKWRPIHILPNVTENLFCGKRYQHFLGTHMNVCM